MSSIENHLDSVKNSIINEMETVKNIVFNGLVENTIINKIPESIFVNYFLGCFIGKVHNPNWVIEWISISGSPMAEVDVINDNTGEVLFRVPGLLHTNNLFLNREDGAISDIFVRYNQLNNNIPSSGLKFLLEALNSKNNEFLSNLNLTDVSNRWSAIFNRYNLINNSGVSVNKDNSLSDAFEY